MRRINEYDAVRVVALKTEHRSYSGSDNVKRPPQVGDIGTVCFEHDRNNPAAQVIVEMVDADGLTVWLADFHLDELELVSRHT
jgi:hypothetical protein